jgi:hypothetical protein
MKIMTFIQNTMLKIPTAKDPVAKDSQVGWL